MKELQVKLISRYGTEAEWIAADQDSAPLILVCGEIAVTIESGGQIRPKLKVGDGIHRWKDLKYLDGQIELSSLFGPAYAGKAADAAAVGAELTDINADIASLTSALANAVTQAGLSTALQAYTTTVDLNLLLAQKMNVGSSAPNPNALTINKITDTGTITYTYNGSLAQEITIDTSGMAPITYTGGTSNNIIVTVDNTTHVITAALINPLKSYVYSSGSRVLSLTLEDQKIYYISGYSSVTILLPSGDDWFQSHIFLESPDLDSTLTLDQRIRVNYFGSALADYDRDQKWEFSIDTKGGTIGLMKVAI